MGLHQMFWIKREMVVKGREREKVHRRRVTHYPRCLAGSSLVILFQFPSALRERERGICWCTSKSSCKSNERPWPRTSSLCIGISWGTAASKPSLLISTWIGCIRRHTLLSRMDDNGRQGRHFRHHHHQLLFPFPSLTWRRRLMVTFPPFQECCFVLSSSSRPRRSLNDAGLVLFCLVTLCDDVCLCLPLDLCAFFRRS